MRQKSDNYSLVLAGGGLALWILFHTIWNILFQDWLKHQLEHLVRHTLAETIEKFGSVGFPALAAIAVIWFLSSYISAQAKAEFADQSYPPSDDQKPSAFDTSWTRDVTILETLWRVFSEKWEVRPQLPLESGGPEAKKLSGIADQLRQEAFEGRLPVWGRRRGKNSRLFEQIPNTFWSNHAIASNYSAYSTETDVWVYVTHPLVVGEVRGARTLEWEDFMTCKTAVDKLLPTSSRPTRI